MTREEILRVANEIANPHGLNAEILDDTYSVGVGGDQRVYQPVICLVGTFVDHKILADISTRISNCTKGCRVTIEIARRSKDK